MPMTTLFGRLEQLAEKGESRTPEENENLAKMRSLVIDFYIAAEGAILKGREEFGLKPEGSNCKCFACRLEAAYDQMLEEYPPLEEIEA